MECIIITHLILLLMLLMQPVLEAWRGFPYLLLAGPSEIAILEIPILQKCCEIKA